MDQKFTHKPHLYSERETSLNTVTSEVRTLVTGWLVQCDKGPIILTVKEDTAKNVFTAAKSKDSSASMQKMIVHVERFKEIGQNLFKPLPKVKDIIDYRNSVIKEWHTACCNIKGSNHQIVWGKIAKKNNIDSPSSDNFNQWIMDHLKYRMKAI
jgi:hypothetical protein